MAVVTCPECGGMVSTTLSNCPHCGFAMPQSEAVSCDTLFELAFKALEAGNEDEFVADIDKILEINPMYYEAWLSKGNALAWQINAMVSEDNREVAYTAWENALKYVPSDDAFDSVVEIIWKCREEAFKRAQENCFANLGTGHYSTEQFVTYFFCLQSYMAFYNEASRRLDSQYKTLTGKETSPFSAGIKEKCDISRWNNMVGNLAAAANADAYKARGLSEMPYKCAAAGLFLMGLEDRINTFLQIEDRQSAFSYLAGRVSSYQSALAVAGFNGMAFFDDRRRIENRASQAAEQVKRAKEEAKRRKQEAEAKNRQKALDEKIHTYWEEHPTEKAEIQSEIRKKQQEISQLQGEMSSFPEITALAEMEATSKALVEKKKHLGLFKREEKEIISAQLDELDSEIEKAENQIVNKKNDVISKINTIKNEIAQCQKRLSNPLLSESELARIKATDWMRPEPTPVSRIAQRKAQEEKEKKKRRITFALVMATLTLVGLVLYWHVIVPNNQYNDAIELSENGEYRTAINIFTSLGDYRDSQERMLQTKYTWAEELLAEKAYDAAYVKFEEIKTYSDAATRMEDVRYAEAEDYLENKKYEYARSIFNDLGNFNDAKARTAEVNYLWAEEYLAGDNLEKALELFTKAGDYSDAQARADEVYEMMQIHATAVKLSKTSLSVSKGKTAELSATMEPADTTDAIIGWTSSDTSVATVDENGVVTAVGAGIATIEVETSNELTATCKVTVRGVSSATEKQDGTETTSARDVYEIIGTISGAKPIEGLDWTTARALINSAFNGKWECFNSNESFSRKERFKGNNVIYETYDLTTGKKTFYNETQDYFSDLSPGKFVPSDNENVMFIIQRSKFDGAVYAYRELVLQPDGTMRGCFTSLGNPCYYYYYVYDKK